MKLLSITEFDVCESTNDEAWKFVPRDQKEDFSPTLVITHRQTKGRGRQGRPWESSMEGNILASLAMPAPERNLGWLPLAAGVATIEALQHACELAGEAQLDGLHLKWPNDILFNQAKMGGILCESRFSGEQALGAVVGLGLNITAAPQIEGVRTASLVKDVLTHVKQPLNPKLLAAMRWFFLREWALRVLSWTSEISDGKTEKLRDTWKKYAKLEHFPDLSVHDRAGKTVKLTAIDLEADGRLKASTRDDAKIVFLDQADSI